VEQNATNQLAVILVDGKSGDRTILWDRDEKLMYREGELRKEEICSGKSFTSTATISGSNSVCSLGERRRNSNDHRYTTRWKP